MLDSVKHYALSAMDAGFTRKHGVASAKHLEKSWNKPNLPLTLKSSLIHAALPHLLRSDYYRCEGSD